MPAKYFIKRNSLSSKWGVWMTGDGSTSTVESLVAELKSNEDAEAYCERIQAGESHEAIIDSLKSGRTKKEGGGLFGRFRKKESDSEVLVAETHNPVIEIEKEESTEPLEATVDESDVTSVERETPIRFEVIEPAPRPVAAESTPEPEPVVEEVDTREAEPTVEEVKAAQAATITSEDDQGTSRVREVTTPSSISERVKAAFGKSNETENSEPVEVTAAVQEEVPVETEASVEPAPVEMEEEVPVAVVETEVPVALEEEAPTAAIKEAELPTGEATGTEESSADDKLLDWSFTPPPDVTPSEVKAESSPETVSEPVEPAPVEPIRSEVEPVRPSAPKIQELSASAAPAQQVRPTRVASEQVSKPAAKVEDRQPASSTGNSGLILEIGVSKALKDVTAGDPRVSDKKYNSVASKEFTEVNKAFTLGNSPEHLREELLHLAAVCLAWADAIEKRGLKTNNSKAA